MDEIKVSVITYVKNDVKHIEKCLKSVLDQTLKEIEYIIVDGGSTDGTLDIIKRFAEADDRIKILTADIGVGKQFNTGLRAARGKYIGICESDDFLKPEMYEKQYEIAEKYDVDYIQADYNNIYEINGVIHRVLQKPYSRSDVFEKLLRPSSDKRILRNPSIGFWSGLFNRDFLINNKIFMNETTGAAYQDTAFFFLVRIYAQKAWIMDEAFYEYRKDNSNSSTNDPKRMYAIIKEYDLLEERLKSSNLWNKYKEYYVLLRLWGITWFYRILDDDVRIAFLPVVHEEIISILNRNEFLFEMFEENENNIVDAAKRSMDDLAEVITPKDKYETELEEVEEKVARIQDRSNIVIFGAGKIGEKLWLFLAERGIFPVAFADNDPSKINTEYCNIPIKMPDGIIGEYGDCYWIIANLKHSEDITKQLVSMGVKSDRVLTCPGFTIIHKMYPYERD